MTAKNQQSPRSPSDMPDFNSGALGLQEESGATTATMLGRPKPQLPPKKAYLTEISQMKKELDEMREEKEQAEEMTNMMTQDLCEIQEEMAKKDDELRRKEADLISWREKAKKLSIELQKEIQSTSTSKNDKDLQKDEELAELRDQIQQLSTSSRQMAAAPGRTERELMKQITHLKTTLRRRDEELASVATGQDVDEKWQATMEEKQLQFDALLKENQELMGAQLIHEQELRRVTEDKIRELGDKLSSASNQVQELRQAEACQQNARAELETKLKEIKSRADTQVKEVQKRALEAEASLQTRMDTDANQEGLLRQISTLEQNIQSQRQRCDWFKKTSERLSTRVKALEQSESAMRREVNDMRLSSGQHRQSIPGSFVV